MAGDPVGAISVHGIAGLWGLLAVGLFADGTYGDGYNHVAGNITGFFYGDHSPRQFIAQLIAAHHPAGRMQHVHVARFRSQRRVTRGRLGVEDPLDQ